MLYDGASIYAQYEKTEADSRAESRRELLIRLAYSHASANSIPMPEKLIIEKGALGKPAFQNAPWLRFSISHSGGIWACAFCRHDVGIDIEAHAERDCLSLARRFFQKDEIEYAARGGTEAFYEVWTAKESYVKLLGTGIDAGFMHFSVIENGRICGDRLFVRFTTIPSPAGYSFCLCRWADK